MSLALASLFISAYFGWRHFSYPVVIVIAVIAAGGFMWSTRDVLAEARSRAYGADSTPRAYMSLVTFLLFIAFAAISVAINSGIYFLARSLSS